MRKRRIAFLLLGSVFVLAVLHYFHRAPALPWRAEYYANEALEGEKNVVKLEHYYYPSELRGAVDDFVAYYNHRRYHESPS